MAVALLGACAARPQPPTAGAEPLRVGATLGATLSAIRAPGRGGRVHLISRLEGHRTDSEPWSRVSARAFERGGSGDLALVVERWCRQDFDGTVYEGNLAAWYLLRGDRLEAFDHRFFGERCAVEDRYRPASRERAPVERLLRERAIPRAEVAPLPVFRIYERGLALAEAGRVEEASEMLALGDARLGSGRTSFARDRLIEVLGRAR